MDNTAKLWDVDTGQQIASLEGHSAEIVSLNFNTDGDKILTGSFDNTAKVWEVRSGQCLHTLAGHRGEISSTQFDFTGDYCITGSIDRTCKLWDVNNGQCMETLRGHTDEVLDVCFNTTGNRLVTASADCTARVYNVGDAQRRGMLVARLKKILDDTDNIAALPKFAQDLTPACGPERLDWCDNKRKKQVQGYMDLPPEELDAKVKEQEDSLAAEVDDLLQSMQKEYAEARQRKEEKVDEIRRGGLGLLKMVQAYRLRQG
eukprot:g22302.t1